MPKKFRVRQPFYDPIRKTIGSMFGGKPPSAMKVAKNAFNIAKKLATAINSEKKYYDDLYASTTVPLATPIVRQVTAIAGGTSVNARIGNSISLNKIVSRQVINWNNHGLTTGSVLLRRMLIVDKNDNGASAPTISQILEDTSNPFRTIMSPMSMNAKERFKVLRDTTYFRDVAKEMFEIKDVIPFPLHKDYKGNKTEAHHCTWNSGTASATQKGHVYEVLMSYQSGSGLSDPSIGGYNRVRYFDN